MGGAARVGILEILQSAAAFFGATTGGFYLAERVTRWRPHAIVIPKAFARGSDPQPFLRIKNNSLRPILVELPSKQQAGHFMVAADDSALGIVRSVTSSEVTVTMDPGEERDFPLLMPWGYKELDDETYMHGVLRWRHAQPMVYIGNRKLSIAGRKRYMRHMIGNARL